jgi:hypothetical protein
LIEKDKGNGDGDDEEEKHKHHHHHHHEYRQLDDEEVQKLKAESSIKKKVSKMKSILPPDTKVNVKEACLKFVLVIIFYLFNK